MPDIPELQYPDDNSSVDSDGLPTTIWNRLSGLWTRMFGRGYDPVQQQPNDSPSVGSSSLHLSDGEDEAADEVSQSILHESYGAGIIGSSPSSSTTSISYQSDDVHSINLEQQNDQGTTAQIVTLSEPGVCAAFVGLLSCVFATLFTKPEQPLRALIRLAAQYFMNNGKSDTQLIFRAVCIGSTIILWSVGGLACVYSYWSNWDMYNLIMLLSSACLHIPIIVLCIFERRCVRLKIMKETKWAVKPLHDFLTVAGCLTIMISTYQYYMITQSGFTKSVGEYGSIVVGPILTSYCFILTLVMTSSNDNASYIHLDGQCATYRQCGRKKFLALFVIVGSLLTVGVVAALVYMSTTKSVFPRFNKGIVLFRSQEVHFSDIASLNEQCDGSLPPRFAPRP